MTKYLAALILLFISTISWAVQQPAETKAQRDQRMQWFREARYGMFIHWGLYSIPAGEWKGKDAGTYAEWLMNDAQIPVAEYEPLAKRFNPEKFDAKAWVKLAKDAGMKYIIITSKHHDGFALWDSKVSTYDVTDASPFKRDILKELADACRDEGMKLGFYHSIMDWHHPDAQAPHFPTYNTDKKKNPNFKRYYKQYLKPQVTELLTNYGDVAVMWFDGQWIPEWTEEMGKDLEAHCRKLQPNVIVNNRVGTGRGKFGLTRGEAAGDFGTPEQEVPPTGFPGVDWETCMTTNNSWGYKKTDQNSKTADQIIELIADTASKGGNLLLNVGPDANGEIPPAAAKNLLGAGEWLKVNGESIYGTSASPFQKLEFGRATRKGNRIFLHIHKWPDDTLRVPLKNQVRSASLLSDPSKTVPVTSSDTGAHVSVSAGVKANKNAVIVLELSGEPQVVQ